MNHSINSYHAGGWLGTGWVISEPGKRESLQTDITLNLHTFKCPYLIKVGHVITLCYHETIKTSPSPLLPLLPPSPSPLLPPPSPLPPPSFLFLLLMSASFFGQKTLIEMSPYKFWGQGGRGRSNYVHVLPLPDAYRLE